MKKLLLAVCAPLLFFLWGCSNGTERDPDTDCSLHSFQILRNDNPFNGMTSDALVCRIGNVLHVTVNEQADVTALVPRIASGEHAGFFIDGKPVVPGQTPADFSGTAELKIVSESGAMSRLSICLKKGNKTIDRKVYQIMETYDIPGISVSATKDERLAYSYGYGFADAAARERVTPRHLFRLASISKTQTALCIMTLVEQGKVKITDRVFGKGGIFERELGTEGLVSGAEKVTVQHLLEHTSGWDGEHIFVYSGPLYGKSVMERADHVIHNVPQTHEPGTAYAYYNLGFGILGKIIEKLSGKGYEDFIREEVYAKAGVKDIWVGKDRNGRRPNEVVYYSQDGTNGYGNDMELICSLGGLIASTEELMKVMSSIDYGTRVPDILRPETLDLMYTPSTAGSHRYCLGWRTNHSIYTSWQNYHGGNLAGTATFWARDSKNCKAAVVLCNSRSYIKGFDNELYDLADIVMKNI